MPTIYASKSVAKLNMEKYVARTTKIAWNSYNQTYVKEKYKIERKFILNMQWSWNRHEYAVKSLNEYLLKKNYKFNCQLDEKYSQRQIKFPLDLLLYIKFFSQNV